MKSNKEMTATEVNALFDAAWWPYLTKLLSKAKGRAVEQESNQHKIEVGMIANEFVDFLRARAK